MDTQSTSTISLAFGTIYLLQADIAEVLINEGVEMNLAIVEEFHQCLLDHLHAPFSLLVNKRNRYTYSYDAQGKLGNLPEINAVAIVAYSRISELATQSLLMFPREVEWNIQMFSDREQAFAWLKEQQQALNSENLLIRDEVHSRCR